MTPYGRALYLESGYEVNRLGGSGLTGKITLDNYVNHTFGTVHMVIVYMFLNSHSLCTFMNHTENEIQVDIWASYHIVF